MKHFYNRIDVLNAEGKEVYSVLSSDKLIKINTEHFAKGIYMVQVKDGPKTVVTKKLIIQ
jgi:hypothetical protein